MTAEPGDERVAAQRRGHGDLRASHADREQVIELLKVPFVQDRLTKDELDMRVGRALAARTGAELAALTADIPAGAGPVRPLAPARRRPLARAAAKSGGCLVFAAAAVWAAFILDPGPQGPQGPQAQGSFGVGWCFVLALYAVLAALGFLAHGVAASREQRRSRRQLPPRPGPGGRALEAEQSSGAGHGPVPPGPRPDQTRADLRTDRSQPGRPYPFGRSGRAPRGIRPVQDAV